MKNTFKGLLIISLCLLITTGCFKRDDLEGITIYTTSYPVEFITATLYKNNSEVLSIYPNGSSIYNYKLSEKQIKEYSKAPIFIYNGLSDEKEYARSFINENTDLRIIDVSYGLKSTKHQESLWLSPNTYLMLATTVKNNLQEYITNKYINEEIQNNYEPLQEALSLLDAELRSTGNAAKDKGTNTIITNSDAFDYLTNYGFNIISLSNEDNITENNLTSLRSAFKAGTYNSIIVLDSIENTDLINELIKSYDLNVITVRSMNTLTEDERKGKETYLTIMKNYINDIKDLTLGE